MIYTDKTQRAAIQTRTPLKTLPPFIKAQDSNSSITARRIANIATAPLTSAGKGWCAGVAQVMCGEVNNAGLAFAFGTLMVGPLALLGVTMTAGAAAGAGYGATKSLKHAGRLGQSIAKGVGNKYFGRKTTPHQFLAKWMKRVVNPLDYIKNIRLFNKLGDGKQLNQPEKDKILALLDKPHLASKVDALAFPDLNLDKSNLEILTERFGGQKENSQAMKDYVELMCNGVEDIGTVEALQKNPIVQRLEEMQAMAMELWDKLPTRKKDEIDASLTEALLAEHSDIEEEAPKYAVITGTAVRKQKKEHAEAVGKQSKEQDFFPAPDSLDDAPTQGWQPEGSVLADEAPDHEKAFATLRDRFHALMDNTNAELERPLLSDQEDNLAQAGWRNNGTVQSEGEAKLLTQDEEIRQPLLG